MSMSIPARPCWLPYTQGDFADTATEVTGGCHAVLVLGNAALDPTPDRDRKSTRLNSSHYSPSRMPSSA